MAGMGFLGRVAAFRAGVAEQRAALEDFWAKAGEALQGSGVRLRPLPPAWRRIGHNRFSVLFVAVHRALGIPAPRRHLYAVLTHCLRSWVTSCDNLLDGELRETVLTDLPPDATVFKSAHALLVADRVLFLALLEAQEAGTITAPEARRLTAVSLAAISASGRQEAEEEAAPGRRLRPERLLRDVHARKAGALFTAPLAAPEALGDAAPGPRLAALRDGLGSFGIAVQILDDLNDLREDLSRGRQNYLASLAVHGPDAGERHRLAAWERAPATVPAAPWRALPAAAARAGAESRRRFEHALDLLVRGGLPLSRVERSALSAGLAALAANPALAERLRAR